MRVLIAGDGARLTSGFGRVIREIAARLVNDPRVLDVIQITSLDATPTARSAWYVERGITPIHVPKAGTLGMELLPEVLNTYKPTVMLTVADPATARWWMNVLGQIGRDDLPIVAYMPIEGGPVSQNILGAFERATCAFTMTEWGAQQVAVCSNGVLPAPRYLYHGVDRSVFHPVRREGRNDMRAARQWDDKFVVAYIARNQWRKSHDRLLKAIALLNAPGEWSNSLPPLRLYLHTPEHEAYWNGGTPLGEMAQRLGIYDLIEFSKADSAIDSEASDSAIAGILNCADLYVHPSKVEGFGLPLAEAMACGTPILVTKDAGNMQEVCGDAPLGYIPVHDWDTWHNGAQLASVAPVAIAGMIRQAAEVLHASWSRERATDPGLRRIRDPQFSWNWSASTIIDCLAEAEAGNFPANPLRVKAVPAESEQVPA